MSDKVKITVRLPKEVWRQVRALAIIRGVDAQDLVADTLSMLPYRKEVKAFVRKAKP